MTEARASQGGLYALGGGEPPTRVSQGGIYALVSTGVPVRVSQAGIYSLTAVTAEVRIAQAGMYLLAAAVPCSTSWAQIWTITRRDGTVFRFVSRDTDLQWGGVTFKACGSLVPSATEAVSEVDAAGSMDLSGALNDEGIDHHELAAGLFDGASVEAWLVDWKAMRLVKALLRGSFGPVEHGDDGFKVEVLGDGAKLQQTPMIETLKPGCNRQFCDARCGKNPAPLTVTGTIDSSTGQRDFVDAARTEPAGYFKRGVVTFTSGANAGISAEIKEHRSGGRFELWPRIAFPMAAGDEYSMLPGCTNLKESSGGTNGCDAWGNYINYGGFLDVPTGDKAKTTADVR